jgi:hypothetical protein
MISARDQTVKLESSLLCREVALTEEMTDEGTCHQSSHALLPPCCDTADLWQVTMTLRQ